jgi:hypothetical protein
MYKRVDKKVRPVEGTFLQEARVHHPVPHDPLEMLPKLTHHPHGESESQRCMMFLLQDEAADRVEILTDELPISELNVPKNDDSTPRPSDVVLYIEPRFIPLIISRQKNYEYRKYLLNSSIKRLWLLENPPVSAITTVLYIGPARLPGEVKDPSGVGNNDFDQGLKTSKYGYPILGVKTLPIPVTTEYAKTVFNYEFPTSHFTPPQWLLDNFPESSLCTIW